MSSLAPIDWFVVVLAAFYGLVLHLLLVQFRRTPLKSSIDRPLVSVVVAARNEAQHISVLLEGLRSQTYDRVEFIIVNDRSTDSTDALVQSAAELDPRVRPVQIVSLSEILPPKKNALTAGIAQARGEILCLTDADCVPPPRWVETMVAHFLPEVGLVAGFSPYRILPNEGASSVTSGALEQFVCFEEVLTSFLAASCARAGFPWLCSGRNLAYRRTVFTEIDGFNATRHSVSGDDDLIMQTVRRRTTWKIVYALDPNTFVSTSPPRNFRAFVNQRIRHFSDGKHYRFHIQAFLFWYHASNTIILAYFVLGLYGVVSLGGAAIGATLKLIVDYRAIRGASSLFQERFAQQRFLLHEFMYIVYNILLGPLGYFERFSWKQ